MNLLPLISVIIPAYNAESRIKFTLESIINQDYENLEIIFVNDSSSDDTALIANKILSESNRLFRIINHEINRGECASRNTGLDNAGGEYICFVDADDMIEKNFVSCLYDTISHENCEIAFCGRVDVFTDNRTQDRKFHAVNREPYVDSGEKFIANNHVPSVWCCMYSALFLKKYNLLFHEGCNVGGDVEFITKALCRAGRVTFMREYLYLYVHHDGMGSVKDNNTHAKKISRYEHNTHAQERTARYLAEFSQSRQVKYLAENILMPYVIIRKFTLCAMKNDREKYKLLLDDSDALAVLKKAESLRVLFTKPEVFMKAFMIINMPGLYYGLREGK